jgi:hypothetical protein
LVVALYIKTEGVVIPPFFSPHFNVHYDQFNKANLLILESVFFLTSFNCHWPNSRKFQPSFAP